MSSLTIDNVTTVTNIPNNTLNITVVSGANLNVVGVVGPPGPIGLPGTGGGGSSDLTVTVFGTISGDPLLTPDSPEQAIQFFTLPKAGQYTVLLQHAPVFRTADYINNGEFGNSFACTIEVGGQYLDSAYINVLPSTGLGTTISNNQYQIPDTTFVIDVEDGSLDGQFVASASSLLSGNVGVTSDSYILTLIPMAGNDAGTARTFYPITNNLVGDINNEVDQGRWIVPTHNKRINTIFFTYIGGTGINTIAIGGYGNIDGDLLSISIQLPPISGIQLMPVNSMENTPIFPTGVFSTQSYVTDGTEKLIRMDFVLSNTLWNFVSLIRNPFNSSQSSLTSGTSINGLVGNVLISGAQGISVLTNGQTITFSGDNSISGNVAQTGHDLYGLVIGSSGALISHIATGLNPSALVGLTPINGSSAAFMRSDAAPAIDQGISPIWSGQHTFSGNGIIGFAGNTVTGGAPSTSTLNVPVSIPVHGNPSILLGEPSGWLKVIISGREARIPYYF